MSTSSSHHTAAATHTPSSTDPISYSLNDNHEDKPTLPYIVGAKFSAHRHIPPPPFGHGYNTTPWPPFKTSRFRKLPQTEYCLSTPPLEGRTLDKSRTLTITGLLRTGYTYSAQIAVVNEHLVAKIYDPVYDSGFDCYDNKRDVVVLADGDYTREAAAYEELAHSHSAAVREVTPEYHGSWTIEVATTIGSKTFTRSVRLLLMQYIQGTVMSSIQALLLPKQIRSNMLRQVLEAETLLYGAGVHHRDIAPRNIIILFPPFTTPHLQLKIIDFNVSNVLRFSKSHPDEPPQSDEVKDKWPGRILGPITRFWDGLQEFEVRDWVGDGIGEANEWLWGAFGGSKAYVPLVRDEERADECPRILNVDGEQKIADDASVDSEDEVVFRGRCK
jgi:hypothetical protein